MTSVDRRSLWEKSKFGLAASVLQQVGRPPTVQGLKFLGSGLGGMEPLARAGEEGWSQPGRGQQPRERARANLALERFRKSTTSQQQASGYGST